MVLSYWIVAMLDIQYKQCWILSHFFTTTVIGDFRGGPGGAQALPVKKWVVENLKEILKYILILLKQVFLTP